MVLRSFIRGGKKRFENLTWLQWLLSLALLLPAIAILCGALGFVGGTRAHSHALEQAVADDVQAQFALGTADLEAGHYDLARQRFEYVIRQEPEFPGAMEALTQALVGVESTPAQALDIPTGQPAPTPTLTATPDTRPLDELFATAQTQLQNQDWQNLAQTIASIRNVDPQYQVVELDRMLFLALRMGGIQKINAGNLGGGAYDLALAEKFTPLDTEANMYRGWARLYQIGVSFWGIYPDKSIYYFSQLAAAAPYLRDSSGIYANERYRLAIIQYGDQFARNNDWCAAVEQYDLAQSLGEDTALQPTAVYAVEQCNAPDEDTTEADEQTATPTSPPANTAVATTPVSPAATPTPTVTQTTVIAATSTPSSTATQAVVLTNTPQPSATLSPTAAEPTTASSTEATEEK